MIELCDGPFGPVWFWPRPYYEWDLASAIEARSDETRSGSAEGESAVPLAADAITPTGDSK